MKPSTTILLLLLTACGGDAFVHIDPDADSSPDAADAPDAHVGIERDATLDVQAPLDAAPDVAPDVHDAGAPDACTPEGSVCTWNNNCCNGGPVKCYAAQFENLEHCH